jgi:hypothetical protein
MPYPHRFTFEKWQECRRCGFHWPKQSLAKDSFTSDVCPECYDKDGVDEEKNRVNLQLSQLDSDSEL